MQAQNRPPKWKPNNQFNVNADLFITPRDPRVIYTLGLLWADGTVNCQGVALREICLKSTNPDAKYFYKIMSSFGEWNRYEYPTKWKPSIQIKTNNKPLAEFLLSVGYGSKSTCSADAILQLVPENFQHYWFLGLMDGDGCIYVKKHIVQIVFTGPYEQDWSYLTSLLIRLGVSFSTKKVQRVKSRFSFVRFTGKNNCGKFLKFIYQGNLGLPRKRNTAKELITS